MIKKPIYTEFNLDAMSGNSRAIAVSHIDDVNTEVLEVCVRQGGSKIDLTGATVTARMVWHKEKTLVSDNVACTVNDSGNVLIPFDNAAIQTHEGILKIEVNITRQRDVLTLQFPIYVKVNDTILADAKVTPESQGTIPELLEEVREELERVQGYVDEGRVFDIIDSILQGDPYIIPSLFVEKNEQDDYQLVYVDSEKEETHVIFNFGNLGSGTKDYSNLENKPSINGVELNGNKTSDDLKLQDKLTAGENISINDDGTISASGGTTNYNELENKPSINGTVIEKNKRHEAYNLFGLSKPVSWLLNFGSLVNNSSKNGILNATIDQVESLPEFMNPKDKHFIIFDYQAGSQGIWDIAVWIDADTNEPKMAFRAGTHSIYSVSDWVELTGGSQIVSGEVNAQGHITFTDSDGNTFTTTGEGVIGADGFSPTATVQQTASGATVTITDKNGTTTANITNGADGQDYVLTSQDKTDIANIVLGELPTTEGVLYGN